MAKYASRPKLASVSGSAWQRHIIGASAILLLFAAGLLFAGIAGNDGPDGLAASLLRMGLVFAVLWLAWPQAFRPASLAVLGTVLVTVFLLARFPRLFPLFLGAVVLWGLFRSRIWNVLRG